MKNLRNIASLLLVLTGLIHISLFFEMTQAPVTIPVLVIGTLFTVTGTLLFKRAKYSGILAIVTASLGIFWGLLVLDTGLLDTPLKILLLLIDLVIVACCVILLLRKEKVA